MKKNIIALLVISFVLLLSNNVFAYSYILRGDSGQNYSMAIRSPLHSQYEFNPINAVYNEPRSGYWHQGTDMYTRDYSVGNFTREVYPVATGTVYGKGITSTGNVYVIVKHSAGINYYSIYMHLDSTSVAVGNTVTTSTKLGYSGESGTVGAPHLHWELNTTDYNYLNGDRVSMDPNKFLVNYYGVTEWSNDVTLVKNVSQAWKTLSATIYGRRNGVDTAPTSNPVIYWQYDYESTVWSKSQMMRGSGSDTFKYSFVIPYDASATKIRYTIYVEGDWFEGYVEYTYYYPKWKYPHNDPNIMSQIPGYYEAYVYQ